MCACAMRDFFRSLLFALLDDLVFAMIGSGKAVGVRRGGLKWRTSRWYRRRAYLLFIVEVR